MISGLRALIFDASTQLGSDACSSGKHQWVSDGGRSCPEELTDCCSQTVYVCSVCGTYDYGDSGGPGAADCRNYCKYR